MSRSGFILRFWFEAVVARLEASQSFPASCIIVSRPFCRALKLKTTIFAPIRFRPGCLYLVSLLSSTGIVRELTYRLCMATTGGQKGKFDIYALSYFILQKSI